MKTVDLKLLAEFVQEGLTGLGVLDEPYEILTPYYDEGEMDSVREAVEHYNNAINFVNVMTPDSIISPKLIDIEDVEDLFK